MVGRGSFLTAAWDVCPPEADQRSFSGRLRLLCYYAGADLSVRCSGQESWLDRACLFRCGLERLHELGPPVNLGSLYLRLRREFSLHHPSRQWNPQGCECQLQLGGRRVARVERSAGPDQAKQALPLPAALPPT